MTEELHRGLEGVLVTETELSRVDGEAGQLIYRGYPIEELARETRFEEVLFLLWDGTLPNESDLDAFETEFRHYRSLEDSILAIIEDLAHRDEDPMAALRTVVSSLSSTASEPFDPEDPEAAVETGRRLTAKIPTILAAYERHRNDDTPIEPREDLSHAGNFLYMLSGEEPDPVLVKTLDASLVLHADHGINASTFAAMVTASTMSDIYAAVTSAIGTLAGPLHGGANQNVMRLLLELDESGKEAGEWIEGALEEGRRIPGFGHRVYQVKDPRAYILADMSEDLGEAAGDMRWYDYSVAIEDAMTESTGIPPNVDFYSATTYYQMDIPIDLYTPIFAMSRVGGWVAHIREQYEDNRIMRPRARYTGPEAHSVEPRSER